MNIEPLLDRINRTPLTAEEMQYAMAAAYFAASGRPNFPIPSEKSLTIEQDDGNSSEISFADIPINRGMFAVMESFKEQGDKGISATSRLMALPKILADTRFKRFFRTADDGSEEISGGLLEALGSAPLSKKLEFNRQAVLRAALKLEAGHGKS